MLMLRFSVLPGTAAGEVIRTSIEQVKAWYDAGYWYPGEGGISCTADDANAAFAQGRAACIFTYSGALSILKNSCDFEIGTFMKPVSTEGYTSKDNIEPDVIFIPSNATDEQVNTAVAFIEAILSQEVQQSIVDNWETPSMTAYTFENVDPLLQEVMAELNSGRLQAGLNPCRTSSEMQSFIKQQIFAAPCGGVMTIDQNIGRNGTDSFGGGCKQIRTHYAKTMRVSVVRYPHSSDCNVFKWYFKWKGGRNMKSKMVQRRYMWIGFAFLAPAIIAYLIFMAYPLFHTFYSLFHKLEWIW